MIRIFKDDYDRSEFYSIVGKFFAEPTYQKQFPYLTNRENTVWYININNKTKDVIAFNSYEIKSSKVEFKSTYFKDNILDLEEILNQQLEDLKGNVIETANANKEIIDLFIKLGFEEYKRTKNYVFLRKEN